MSGNDPEDELRGEKNQKNQKCLASKEIRVVEKLETLYIFGHKAKDVKPPIAQRKEQ